MIIKELLIKKILYGWLVLLCTNFLRRDIRFKGLIKRIDIIIKNQYSLNKLKEIN